MILLHLKLEGRRVNGSRMTMDVPEGAVSYDNNGIFLTPVGRAAYSLCFDVDDEIAVLLTFWRTLHFADVRAAMESGL